MSIDCKNIGAPPLSATDRERLKALERKVLDSEGPTDVELRERDALLKGHGGSPESRTQALNARGADSSLK